MSTTETTDVLILGGGLAGLTLARQLRREVPDVAITVVEKRKTPYPATTHKVGESTVEIGAHYLDRVVGLGDHLRSAQLRKYGLRLFFGDYKNDLANADELGTTRELAIPTWQVDRGVLENQLIADARHDGDSVIDGAKITGINLGRNDKFVDLRLASGDKRIKTRWLIDAAGRTSVVKPRLGLTQASPHRGDAVWFRVDQRIDVDEWSSSPSWRTRCGTGTRWLSTNHLMGPGYWVWIIPLAGGATSVGIVTDPNLHPASTMASWPHALRWLAEHQPLLHTILAQATPLDFRVLRNYPHGCSKVLSPERWALAGEAGVFLDPFYSPGTDFIGIGNTFISDIVRRDRCGEDISVRAGEYQRLFMSFYESTLLLYKDLYSGFGDAELMNVKTVWDYAYYWGILAPVFFSRALVDSDAVSKNIVSLAKTQRLNREMQQLFRERAKKSLRQSPRGIFIDQSAIPCLARYNDRLRDYADASEDFDITQDIHANAEDLKALSVALSGIIHKHESCDVALAERELLGDFRRRLAG